MNKFQITTACFFVIAVVASAWLTFPWKWHIERRVSKIGTANITQEFDAWWTGTDKTRTQLSVESLPPSLRVLCPLEVRREADGVYLVMKRMFVMEDGIFIAAPGTEQAFGTGTDPTWRSLGDRVYYYHISG